MNYLKEISNILARQHENGGSFWSREDGDIHAPHGKSTIDTLMVLGELGARENDYPILSKAIDFLFTYQTAKGCFNIPERVRNFLA